MAVLHVKSPNGTDYNMSIVTSGVTENLTSQGWVRLPNGMIIQWIRVSGSQSLAFNIEFNEVLVSAAASETNASDGWAGTNQTFTVFGLGDFLGQTYRTGCYVRQLAGHLVPGSIWMSEDANINSVWTFIGY